VENWLERRVLRIADAVIMNTPTARSNLLAKYNWLDKNKVHVISHGFDGDTVESSDNAVEIDSKKRNDYLSIVYAGGFYSGSPVSGNSFLGRIRSMLGRVKSGMAYNILERSERVGGSSPETVLRAIAEYNAAKVADMPRVEMHFIGTGSEQLQCYISEMGLEGDVFIHPRVTTDEVRHTLQHHDLLYLTNPPLLNSPFVGTKTFDYLAAGRPIIAELCDGDQARIILAAKAGWVISPGSHQVIVDIFSKIATGGDGENGINTHHLNYISLFKRKHQIDDLMEVIDQVVRNKPRYSVISQGYREIADSRKNKAP
jgi:glycosyltransferase involved in cell wall biosynthesis